MVSIFQISQKTEQRKRQEFVIKSKDKLFDSFCVEAFLMLFQMKKFI